jgi:hypothetical protein
MFAACDIAAVSFFDTPNFEDDDTLEDELEADLCASR